MKNIILTIVIFFSLNANAEILREVKMCNDSGKMCFYWWPKLKEIQGWKQDIGHSYHYKMNTQAPVDFTFADAEVVIYARAIYKPERPNIKNINEFIQNDKTDFLSQNPSLSINQSLTLKDKKNRSFFTFQFIPSNKGNWEQIAYSEEIDNDNNEYYLVFVLSSRTKSGYKTNIDTFNEFIQSYE